MKHFNKYKRIIATKHKSNGNETVGDMWTETKTFNKGAAISEIIEWGKDCGGNLVITIDEEDTEDSF